MSVEVIIMLVGCIFSIGGAWAVLQYRSKENDKKITELKEEIRMQIAELKDKKPELIEYKLDNHEKRISDMENVVKTIPVILTKLDLLIEKSKGN